MGNNRVITSASGSIVQSNHYYPFGMYFAEGSATSQQPYKYNGKKLDTERGFNLYDYSARLMDLALGRFNMVDPMEWIGIKVMRMKPDIYGGKVIKILLGGNSPLSGNSKSELFNGLINRERSEIEHRIGKTLVGIAAVEFAGALAGRALAFSGSWLKVLFKGATKGVAETEKVMAHIY
ncbi:RHS repeat domain-containing protein [Bacteroides graminisolvens]|uniref:RHS repeat domain-containing protein n=1 Tax=Bacteroides graminisolvens TaxID=477666 RepID=UPI003A85AFEA